MINNFEKQIFDWLYKCPYFQSLYLVSADLTSAQPNSEVVITPDVMGVDDVYIKRFFRNNGKKRYIVNVAQFYVLQSIKNKGALVNVNTLDETKNLQQWVEEQTELPDIGYEILKLETTGVTLASVDEDGTAKAQFQILIDYFYKEEE